MATVKGFRMVRKCGNDDTLDYGSLFAPDKGFPNVLCPLGETVTDSDGLCVAPTYVLIQRAATALGACFLSGNTPGAKASRVLLVSYDTANIINTTGSGTDKQCDLVSELHVADELTPDEIQALAADPEGVLTPHSWWPFG